jgi:hypothetical protein
LGRAFRMHSWQRLRAMSREARLHQLYCVVQFEVACTQASPPREHRCATHTALVSVDGVCAAADAFAACVCDPHMYASFFTWGLEGRCHRSEYSHLEDSLVVRLLQLCGLRCWLGCHQQADCLHDIMLFTKRNDCEYKSMTRVLQSCAAILIKGCKGRVCGDSTHRRVVLRSCFVSPGTGKAPAGGMHRFRGLFG